MLGLEAVRSGWLPTPILLPEQKWERGLQDRVRVESNEKEAQRAEASGVRDSGVSTRPSPAGGAQTRMCSSRMAWKQFHTQTPGPTLRVGTRFQSPVASSFQLTELPAKNDK